ncbi:MAG: O-antigen ligase family protein, partial [Deltaproteobacteria bacterium]|nr:O-antigen ligase family protein [Deltaproteobacteria bacterium]
SLLWFLIWRLSGGWVIAIVCSGLPIMLYFSYIGAYPLMERFALLAEASGGELRRHVWWATVSIIKDYPIVGTGLGTFETVFWGYRPIEAGAMWWQSAHNDYLQIMAETGILGALIAGCLVFTLLRSAVRSIKKGGRAGLLAVSLLCAVTGFLMSLLTTSSMGVPANMLFFSCLAGLIIRGREDTGDGHER